MIAKKFKLPIQNFVGQSGKVIRNPHFILKFFPTNNNFSRFGLVISKKVHAGAVQRNKIKRLIFNLIQTMSEKLPVNDYLVIISPSAQKLSDQEIEHEFRNLFTQL